jgi:hypothetical protein
MNTFVAVLALAFVVPVHAQDLAPELEPLAAKHKADLTAFNAQKAAAMARAQQPYLFALDGAERTATSTGSIDTVAAITKEREALKNGAMDAVFPGGLPKTLQAPRKACLDAMTRVAADLEPRRKTINAAYLQGLGSLQAKAVGKPDLAAQIASEKEKLIANAGDESPEAAKKRYVGRWNVCFENGTVISPRTLNADGTSIPSATWEISDNKLKVHFDNGGMDTFDLPLRGDKLTGVGQDGRTRLILKKVK